MTASLFLLLRTQDITSEVFTCPSSNAEKDNYGGGTNAPINRSNFSFSKNISYSYQDPFAGTNAIGAGFKFNNTLGSEFAVAADINPGTSNNDNVCCRMRLRPPRTCATPTATTMTRMARTSCMVTATLRGNPTRSWA